MYDLGIIGGMGPLATAEIYKSIIKKTKANSDQEHMSIVILNKPSIPDRSDAILNNKPSPVDSINECINELVNLKVKNFIIACNTAHYFASQLKMHNSIDFINMIDEVLIKAQRLYRNRPIIILSTTGTIKANIYKLNHFRDGLNIIYPDIDSQKIVMNYIYDIKNGKDILYNVDLVEKVMDELKSINPNPVYVLACTELSMLGGYLKGKYTIIDAVDALVEAVIKKCGYKLK